MVLSKLVEKLDYELLSGSLETEVSDLCYDSRYVEKGNLFLCVPGTVVDGHDYIPGALEKGASVLVVTKDVQVDADVAVVKVADAREALAVMSAAFFDYPAEKLITIGITGTKGKTTTAYMVYHMLNNSGMKTGLIGTVENIIGDRHIPASHSTPESYLIQKYFAEMVEEGVQAVVMEVSSQGLKMKRVFGINFDFGVFTNMGHDHIGPREHESIEEYRMCKGMLFRQCKTGIVNADDPEVARSIEGYTCKLLTYGTKETCDYRATEVNLHSVDGTMGVRYVLDGKKHFPVRVNIPGAFSVYNSLTAISIVSELNVAEDIIQSSMEKVKVRGRVEPVDVSKRFTVMVDYAHNKMALESLLTTLREYEPGRLVCVFGCGGNRSKDRRFEMGEVSSKLADLTIATSDNPRMEEPQDILNDIITGIQKADGEYIAIIDRREAIHYALEHAQDGDCIVIAGKGHEDYQEIKGVKYHMDDVEMILEEAEKLRSEKGSL